MTMFNPTAPIGFLMLVLQTRVQHARESERGASAVEWVVISAIVVGIVLIAAGLIVPALQGKAEEVSNDIQSG